MNPILVAGATLVIYLVTEFLKSRARKADSASKDTKLNEIHVLVNSRLSEALERIAKLEEMLKAAGKVVPEDANLPKAPDSPLVPAPAV